MSTYKDAKDLADFLKKAADDPIDLDFGLDEEEDSPTKERRFRVTLYADVFVPDTNDPENDKGTAEQKIMEALSDLRDDEGLNLPFSNLSLVEITE